MGQDFDFKAVADHALRYSTDVVPELLPGGKMMGQEWIVGSKNGGPGDSMRVNLSKGAWADFATDERGLDLISLVACVKGLKMIEAGKWLAQRTNYRILDVPLPRIENKHNNGYDTIVKPPADFIPNMDHFRWGKPTQTYTYRDENGDPIYWIARYDIRGHGKEFMPWAYSREKGRCIAKAWPRPRPLYNLHKLKANPTLPVLIVEGEKAVAGAERLGFESKYVVTTWPNGSKSVANADWSVLAGRNILIWPDADEPGRSAADIIANMLVNKCPSVKIISPDREDGWDAWDAYQEEMGWEEAVKWAKERVKVYSPQGIINNGFHPEEPPAEEPEIVEPIEEKPVAVVRHEIELVERAGDEEKEQQKTLQAMGCSVNRIGRPYLSVANVEKILSSTKKFSGHFWYDGFSYRVFTDWNGTEHELGDVDIIDITVHIQRYWGLPTIGSNMVYDACVSYAKSNPRHSVQTWVNSLKWDGTERIKTFFMDYLGSKDTAYTRAVSHNFWVGMIARAYRPGCKNDYMVVLEGPQGIGKSMALSAIGRKWHTESTESVGSKDFFQNLHGKLIVEIAELDSFSKAEVTRVKQVITSTFDRFRPPYGRVSADHQRQCIFVGTTNESSYLRDATGARRFWPIACGQIKLDQINSDRDQLFAEAYHWFREGHTWHEVPEDEAQQEQEHRYQHDELEVKVKEYLAGKHYILMVNLAKEGLGVDTDKLDIRQQRRIGAILRRVGWDKRQGTLDGQRTYIWQPKDAPPLVDQELLGEIGF